MPYRKSLIKGPSKLSQKEYDTLINDFYKKMPFHEVQGKLSPYTGTKIESWHDYMLYAHCYVMKSVIENHLLFVEQDLQDRCDTLSADLRSSRIALCDMRDRNEYLERTCKKRTVLLWLSVILSVCLFLFSLSLPSGKAYSALASENEALSQQLSDAQITISDLNKAVDQSYKDGYSAGSRISKSSSPSYSGSWDSEPAVETYYIGNASTKKFHRSTCSFLPASENQVALDSYEEAIDKGFNPCMRCDP